MRSPSRPPPLLLAAICAVTALTAIVLMPTLDGRFPGEPLVVALPCAAALALGRYAATACAADARALSASR